MAYPTKEEVIVSADSRSVMDNGHRDDACKISTLGNKVVYARSGQDSMDFTVNTPDGRHVPMPWDSEKVALQAFDFARKHPDQKLVPTIAEKWEKLSSDYFTRLLRISPETVLKIPSGDDPNNSVIDAFFVGKDRNGGFSTLVAEVNVDKATSTMETKTYPIPAGKIATAGYGSVAREFFDQTSERAKKIVREWRKTVKGKTPIEQNRLFITQLIKWTILYDTSGHVGGDVDTVVFNASGVHWIYRKENCKDAD